LKILTLPCDVVIPAAMERVIDAKVAKNLRCRIVAEGANGPTTPDADLILEQRQNEIFLIPDILYNSGGVIVSYFEWVQDLQHLLWEEEEEEEEVMRREYRILDHAFDQMAARAKQYGVFNRTAAMAIGVERVRGAKNTRGLFP
jgi:glutamate dehydrogenase (NAD(P)+)